MSEHTPGPWQIVEAAPDLLLACQSLLEGLKLRGLLDGWAHDANMITDARAAVAKALPAPVRAEVTTP